MTALRLVAGALALGLVGAGSQVEAMTFSAGGAQGAPASELLLQVAVQPYSLTYTVRNLQILLNELGYNVGTPDGAAGAKTKNAIAAFQSDKGFPVNGQPSKVVFIQLQTAVAAMQGGGVPQGSSGTQASASTSSDLVVNIQAELRKRGYNIPSLTGSVDGATAAAIRAYQQDAGLAVTGKASQALLTQLASAPGSAASSAQAQREQVKAIQEALNTMGYDAGPADGALGPKVRAAIRTYEADNGMAITGNVSEELMASLGAGSSGYDDGGSYDDASYDDESDYDDDSGYEDDGMSGGASGEATQEAYEIEQYLEALGYDTGTVDGVADAKTKSAIMSFQNDMDLPVDGQASTEVLTELQTAYNEALAEAGGTTGDTGGYDETGGYGADPATVQAIEQALKQKGYKVGSVDGTIDANSQKAIDDFIRHAQLTIANEPSDELLAAIQGSTMTAKKGMQQDLIKTGVDALTNILTQ